MFHSLLFISFPSGCRIYFKWFVQLPAKQEYMFRLFATFPDWTGVSSGGGNVRKQVSRCGRSATIVWSRTDSRKEMIEDKEAFSPFDETRALYSSFYFSWAHVLQFENRASLAFSIFSSLALEHSATHPSAGCRVGLLYTCHFVNASFINMSLPNAKITAVGLSFFDGVSKREMEIGLWTKGVGLKRSVAYPSPNTW